MTVEELIGALIEREGGYVNHPADRGGPMNYGITEAVARAHGYAGAMRDLPREEAAAIYRRLYWLRPRFDEVAKRSRKVAEELFDTGVNMGPQMITKAALPLLALALTSCANRTQGPRPIPAVAEQRQCLGYALPPAKLLEPPVKLDFLIPID